MRPRLQRLERIYTRHPVYFLTLCTALRTRLLADRSLQTELEMFASEASKREIYVGRYILMPDHLHLFIAVPEDLTLGSWVKSLKNSLSKALRESGHLAPHWQKGYFDHLLRSEKSYEEKWLYVRDNPVRAELVEDAAAWPYSGEITALCFTEA